MQPFFQWFDSRIKPSEPWLILGKGPSFASRSRFDLSQFHLLSLNHAVREQPVLVAHVIDLEVIQSCGDAIEKNAQVLVMPWYPHASNVVGHRTLEQIAAKLPILRELNAEGRLLWYDLSTSAIRHGEWPIIQATYFSAEAALNLLALAGARQVRSLGVDGGSAYSGAFEDLRNSTLLANGRQSFDLQFGGFARTILGTGVDFAPLDLLAPARIYVAHTSDEVLPVAVLRHSIRRHCSLSVELVTLAVDNAEQVPEGPAVLLPPRAHVLADLGPLWRGGVREREVVVPDEGERIGGPGLAVVGAGLSSAIPALASMIRRRAPFQSLSDLAGGKARATLAADWNPGGRSEPDYEALVLYYSPDGSEPWNSRSHPLGHLWVRDLLDAVRRGFVQPELVAQEVSLGHIRPSLLYQVEHDLEEPLLLPRRARLLDRDFSPSQRSGSMQPAARHWAGVTRAVAREARRRLRLLRSRWSGSHSSHSTENPQTNLVVRP
ncbi:MAG TPA: hypothetical protein VJ808_08570 [Gemmatimonadales bacterium]|nr:hypothetical protein [Gemmatimonadales bacterium]